MGAFEEADFPDAPPVLPTVIEGACGWPVREKVNRAAPTRPKPFGVLIFDNWECKRPSAEAPSTADA